MQTQNANSGPVDVMVAEVTHHGTWFLSGNRLKVAYGTQEERAVLDAASPPVAEMAQRLLREIVLRG